MIKEFLISLIISFSISMVPALILMSNQFTKCINIIKNRWGKSKRKYVVYTITALVIISTGIWMIIYGIENRSDFVIFDDETNDVSNWVTLTVEIGVGVAIAIIVLIFSHSQNQKIADEVKNQIKLSEENISERFEYAQR